MVKPVQTTTSEKRPMLSSPKQIPIQSLLYKTTACLTRPATTFLTSKWKKTCLKQQLQNFIQQRNAKKQKQKTNKKHKEQCIKNKPLSDFEHVSMRLKVNSNRFEMSFCLHGNLHGDFTAATFQTIARLYCTCANDIF